MTVIRVVDPLDIAQERLKKHLTLYPVQVVGTDDDLQVAEVAALIAIAQGLRVLAKNAAERPDKPSEMYP